MRSLKSIASCILLACCTIPINSHAQSGGIAWFDAPTESYVDLGSTNNSNCFSDLQNYSSLTVTMWVKWDDKNATNVGNWANRLTYADSSGNGDNGTFWCQHDNGNNSFEFAVQTQSQFNSREYVQTTTNPQNGTWYHVAGVYDGFDIRIYVNGALENTQQVNFWLPQDLNVSDGSKLNMGRWPNSANNYRYFDGSIDEVSVWNRDLSQSEIQSIMSNPESVTGTSYDANGLIGYWDFDDYTVEDKSPCNNGGTSNGSFTTVPAGSDVTRSTASGSLNDPANWDNGVPNDTLTAVMEHNMELAQSTSSKNFILKDSLAPTGDTLIIKGDLIHEGRMLNQGGGALEFNGSTTSTRNIRAKSPLTVSRMFVDVPSEVKLDSGKLQLKEELRIASGTLDVGNKELTLLSDSNGTARIAPLPSNTLIKGEVAVQRWIPSGNAGWVDMGSPNRDQVTLAEWDDDIYLSGKSTGGFNDGCSWSGGCFWSVKRADNNGVLQDVTSTSTPLENGRGYEVFMGDNGGVNVMNSDTTITVKGRIKTPGSFSIDVNDGQWDLVANPFASPIDFDQLNLNNVDPYYYVAAATGSYESYNKSTGSSSHPNVGPIISSSQGFWVKGNGSNASITVEQNFKSSASATFSKNGTNGALKLTLRNSSNGLSSNLLLHSGIDSNSFEAVEHKATPVIGAPDLYSLGRDGEELRSRSIPEDQGEVRIPLKVTPKEQGTYGFSIDGLEESPFRSAVLVDEANDREHSLSKKGMVQVRMSTSDSTSSRFYLRLGDDPTSINASEENEESSITVRSMDRTLFVRKKGGAAGNYRLNVLDANGKRVRESEEIRLDGSGNRVSVDLSDGIYFVRLQGDDGITTKKLPIGIGR